MRSCTCAPAPPQGLGELGTWCGPVRRRDRRPVPPRRRDRPGLPSGGVRRRPAAEAEQNFYRPTTTPADPVGVTSP